LVILPLRRESSAAAAAVFFFFFFFFFFLRVAGGGRQTDRLTGRCRLSKLSGILCQDVQAAATTAHFIPLSSIHSGRRRRRRTRTRAAYDDVQRDPYLAGCMHGR
jgi:hypothetical protein